MNNFKATCRNRSFCKKFLILKTKLINFKLNLFQYLKVHMKIVFLKICILQKVCDVLKIKILDKLISGKRKIIIFCKFLKT